MIIEDDQRTQTASSPRQGKGEALRHQGDAETDTQGPHRSGPASRTIAPALDCPPEVLSPLRCLDREPEGTASRRANRTVMIWELPSPSNKPTSVAIGLTVDLDELGRSSTQTKSLEFRGLLPRSDWEPFRRMVARAHMRTYSTTRPAEHDYQLNGAHFTALRWD